ncbi:4'-phosphopantetheinyl transferase family protein [Yersinia pseudotuberculosis]|uniref:4'-phosphopantetheinyl transferase family protein n=1 Tax=Yersinia pseudotuberculosis TaxID=633 RepID=UPI0005E78015|nr:4'-phosphopantetheinyl transferase [Yersinia pseudotuberculosis]AXY33326.1 phosphopantetheinyl transferase [Yersinia pseudotuberculosis]AYX12426.1 4'-phosphopantetheinyl transferase superfamily protein [Yersinia pseudotuberculosis]MBO1566250.1 4'-phosphopantetheinyl transferase superfamily protein [Yersinia pseudotuberculosis]MBO1587803.1 4'-phosphopantetheinyl transferase superfamily protein [Yersinia pseudotuberculosis]MBO1603191.1 4'-phosphopantetheinyl transferase superfamily protein [Y
MTSVFIRNFTFAALPANGLNGQPPFHGLLAKCDFEVNEYRDELFAAYGIPFPGSLNKAVIKRRAEYLAGRFVARQVLNLLDIRDYPLATGMDRAPQWPTNLIGSISHNNQRALCAAQMIEPRGVESSTLHGIGLDIESHIAEEKAQEIWLGIISDEEYSLLQQGPLPFNQALTLVFSAKESLFKAVYPQSGRYFDFIEARLLSYSLVSGNFELQLLRHLNDEFPAGRCFSGCFSLSETDLQTFIAY